MTDFKHQDRSNPFPDKYKSYLKDHWLAAEMPMMRSEFDSPLLVLSLAAFAGFIAFGLGSIAAWSEAVLLWILTGLISLFAVFLAAVPFLVMEEKAQWTKVEAQIDEDVVQEMADFLSSYIRDSKAEINQFSNEPEIDKSFKYVCVQKPSSELANLLSTCKKNRMLGIRYMLAPRSYAFSSDLTEAQALRTSLYDRLRADSRIQCDTDSAEEVTHANAA